MFWCAFWHALYTIKWWWWWWWWWSVNMANRELGLRVVKWCSRWGGSGGTNIFLGNAALQMISGQGERWYCKKFGDLMIRKVTEIVATRCHISKLKCTKFDFGSGSAPDPAGGAYSAPSDPLAWFMGLFLKKGRGGRRGGNGKEEPGGKERRGGE